MDKTSDPEPIHAMSVTTKLQPFKFDYDARKPQTFKVSKRREVTIQACDCGAADAGPGFQIHALTCTFLASVNEAAGLLEALPQMEWICGACPHTPEGSPACIGVCETDACPYKDQLERVRASQLPTCPRCGRKAELQITGVCTDCTKLGA